MTTLLDATASEVSRELAQAVFRVASCFDVTTDAQALAMRDAVGLARQVLKVRNSPPSSLKFESRPDSDGKAHLTQGALSTRQ
jgi:hypothetical protein